ncbi:ubiquinone biosynthesis protein UbiH [Allofranklinella schreckenbergeri]|uniref:Ubiquinone biosynthesis protein UbiH n=1 Tax=Allofranklinella schreckenbergeri TaxID=1076744 RepID=A0A3M6QEL7_9BURK|nr:OB-fold-containig protein [Allofranklinella schreckenbergeri]RMX01477.1 ubiquinone biosynthesis protein UbiH [Allofranklinella schreckenbergeri]
MHSFLQIVTSFPTVVFSILLAVVVLYWLVVALGLLETEVLDSLFFDADGLDGADAGALAGLLSRLGLGGVPLTVILSLIVLFGWLASYFAVLIALPLLGHPAVHFALGAAVFAAASLAAIALTSLALKPVRALLRKIPQEEPKTLLGRVGVVRSASVNAQSGYAAVDDGGAGLVLQIRTHGDELPRGSRVVLIEPLPEQRAWRVVSEEEFNTGALP